MGRLQVPQVARRAAGKLGDGLPGMFVAALAAFVLVAILYTIANRDPNVKSGSFAELTLTRTGCSVDPTHSLHVASCTTVSPRVFRVAFTVPLGTFVIGSRGSCCPGGIGASVESRTTALVALDRSPRRRPVRASILAP